METGSCEKGGWLGEELRTREGSWRGGERGGERRDNGAWLSPVSKGWRRRKPLRGRGEAFLSWPFRQMSNGFQCARDSLSLLPTIRKHPLNSVLPPSRLAKAGLFVQESGLIVFLCYAFLVLKEGFCILGSSENSFQSLASSAAGNCLFFHKNGGGEFHICYKMLYDL